MTTIEPPLLASRFPRVRVLQQKNSPCSAGQMTWTCPPSPPGWTAQAALPSRRQGMAQGPGRSQPCRCRKQYQRGGQRFSEVHTHMCIVLQQACHTGPLLHPRDSFYSFACNTVDI